MKLFVPDTRHGEACPSELYVRLETKKSFRPRAQYGRLVRRHHVVQDPCFIDEGVLVKTGARIGPYSVIGRQCQVEEEARIDGAIVWQNGRIGKDASITNAIIGRNCHIGRSSTIGAGTVLGDKSSLTDYTRV